jgi:adenosylcobinamide kinase/adenosylcobinamide-phosphate guanylyltransferase
MASSLLVLGGARSGKSRFAVTARSRRGRVAFVATAQAGDADMASRIARHQAERPREWRTIDAPLDLAAALRGLTGAADAVLVDCITLWVSNRLLRGDSEDAILAEADDLATIVAGGCLDLTLVSNEVGEGVHPPTADGLRFRDLLGLVNQRLAAAADEVVLMVAGIPLTVKRPPTVHDVAIQAP